MSSTLPAITMINVTKKYRLKTAIEDINLSFLPGRLYVITGPNGSGKSTILKCIMGLLHYEGRIERNKLKIGYAPEQYILPEYMTVYDFLFHLGRIKSTEIESVKTMLDVYLNAFNMIGSSTRRISTLSNGMKQKINLIQALIHQPNIILLDEPFRAIDGDAQMELLEIIKRRLHDSVIIISTHQPKMIPIRQKMTVRLHEGRVEM